MKKRFLLAVWLPVIWLLYQLDALEFFALVIVAVGLYEILYRYPWTSMSLVAVTHMAGFLLILFFSKGEIWFLIWIVVANDICAYFGGRTLRSEGFKKHPFPATSPNKTVGGYIYGIIAGTTAGVIAASYFGLPFIYQPFALLVCFLAIAGDLLESKFKRFYGIKDSGDDLFTKKLLCGHGGVYDRFDAISAVCIGWFILIYAVKNFI